MQLINEKTKQPVKTGDVVHDFRGRPAFVTGWREPQTPQSTGRVYTKTIADQAFDGEYYPSVYGLKWEAV